MLCVPRYKRRVQFYQPAAFHPGWISAGLGVGDGWLSARG